MRGPASRFPPAAGAKKNGRVQENPPVGKTEVCDGIGLVAGLLLALDGLFERMFFTTDAAKDKAGGYDAEKKDEGVFHSRISNPALRPRLLAEAFRRVRRA
jgi:hypothetical protein